MSKLKEVNLWLIYIIITIIIVFISFLTFYNEWKSLKNKYTQQLISLNRITSQNTLSFFNQQESIFRILGDTLLRDDANNYPERSRKTVEKMLSVNKSLVAFGLAAYNGQLLLVSNIEPKKSLPNLMENQKSKKSFEKARKSNSLMLGRTYLLKSSNTWGMPIRMAIKNKYEQTVFVLTAGISLDGGNSALNVKELPDDYKIQVLRADAYIQFQNPIAKNEYDKVYNKPYSKKLFNKIKKLKNNELVVFNSIVENDERLSAAIYIKQLDLYTIVSIPYQKIIKEYQSKIYIWLSLLLVLIFVLFIIFKYTIDTQTAISNKLKYIARNDSLTDLPNRFALYEEIDKKVKNQEKFYLFFLDLDNFKFVNDTYGHFIGDRLLKHVATLLKSLISSKDYIARQSGDEFILLISEQNHEPVRNLAIKILELFEEEIILNNNEIFTSVSIGIANYEKNDKKSSDILNKADIALYKAKETKSSYVFFSESLYKESKQYLDIEVNLRKAIKNNEFSIVYQPKILANTKKIVGVEALIRWKNNLLGLVSPEIFIPIAEKSGFINEIGEYVLKNAQKDILDVWAKTNNKFFLSVNVSPRQISTNKDASRLKTLIKDSSFPAQKFIIEVTENVFIKDINKTIALLKEFRSLNIGVSLDDFGTGYSSLSILSKLPINELKIDKSFIKDIELNNDNLMLVKTIINIATSMNLNVVAEGVETQNELAILDDLACEIYQGYYFSKALNKEDLIDFINKQK